MKCFVETCPSTYTKKPTDNEKRRSMFRPQTEEMVQAWNKVISRKDRELKKNDVVCELHFKEEDIDRERVIYKRGGIVERVPRKIPLLNPGVVPSVFPEPVRERTSYAIKLDQEVLLKQREIYEEVKKQSELSSKEKEISNDCEPEEYALSVEVSSSELEEGEISNHIFSTFESSSENSSESPHKNEGKIKPTSKITKIKLYKKCWRENSLDSINERKVKRTDLSRKSRKNPKKRKILNSENNLFETLANAINSRTNLFPFLNKSWLSIVADDKYIIWICWKDDFSVILKRVMLFADLRIRVFLKEEETNLVEMKNVTKLKDVEALLRTVVNISFCN